MKAIILAAGLGTRLNLKNVPKPMYKIKNKPILEYNILLVCKHNVKDICINLHYMPEVIKNYFGDGNKWGVRIQYSLEKHLLGTSGAVRNIEWFWDKEPFFVIYGDNYTNINLTEMLQFHLANKSIATIAVFDPKKVKNSGIASGFVTIDENNKLLSFTEGGNREHSGYVNAGIYILEPSVLNIIPSGIPSDFGKDIFPKLLKNKSSLFGYVVSGFVMAIDTENALEAMRKFVN